jgi:hypothetical protein
MNDTTTTATPITVTAQAEFIEAALCAVSKEETRYYLKGVFLDARGFIAATNGHMAFAARCSDAYKLIEDYAGHLDKISFKENKVVDSYHSLFDHSALDAKKKIDGQDIAGLDNEDLIQIDE